MKYIIVFILLLTGCSEGDPITLKESDRKYLGVWQRIEESKTDTSIEVDNILVGLYEDSSAELKKCRLSATWSKPDRTGSKSSSRNSVLLPSAVITELSSEKLVLEQSVSFINVDHELLITKQPYIDAGRWHIGIDNKILQKLDGSDIRELSGWECPEIEQESKV